MPLLSIVMPTYNRAKVIQHAIRSIIDQTVEDWELIIVDDGSTDNTEEVITSFADPRIKYFKLEHSGNISYVRNRGNEKATADYIVVQDSDDMSFPDRLEEIYRTFKETDADVVYHGWYYTFVDPYHNAKFRGVKPAQEFDKRHLLREQYIPGQIAYKRKVVMETPYDERVRCCDDYQILLELALKNYVFRPIFKNLYEYYYSKDSVNISGEADGSRKRDVEIIISILKEKYGMEATATLFKNTVEGEISKENI